MGRQLVWSDAGGTEVENPASPRELGHPDAVEHHEVKARLAALEIDDQELALLVRGPGQHLGLDPDAGMRRFELGEEGGNGIDGSENLGVLEDDGERALGVGRAGAAEQREKACGEEAESRDRMAP